MRHSEKNDKKGQRHNGKDKKNTREEDGVKETKDKMIRKENTMEQEDENDDKEIRKERNEKCRNSRDGLIKK